MPAAHRRAARRRAYRRVVRPPRPVAHRLVLRRNRPAARRRVASQATIGAAMIGFAVRSLRFAVRCGWLVVLLGTAAGASAQERHALIVTGATGGAIYAVQYREWSETLRKTLVDALEFEPDRTVIAERNGYARRRRDSGQRPKAPGDAPAHHAARRPAARRAHRPWHLRRRRRQVQPGRAQTWNRRSGRRCCAACPAAWCGQLPQPRAFRSSNASPVLDGSSSRPRIPWRSVSTPCSPSTSSPRSRMMARTSTRTAESRSGKRSRLRAPACAATTSSAAN